MHQTFTKEILIRFSHCDSAGIVFHPHYFTMFNGLIEDFFAEVVEKSFTDIIRNGLVLPVAGVHCNFLSPCKAGDVCKANLWIEKLGFSSVRFAMTLTRGETECVRLTETMVCVSQAKGFKPVALPETFREKMLPYLLEEGATPLTLRS